MLIDQQQRRKKKALLTTAKYLAAPPTPPLYLYSRGKVVLPAAERLGAVVLTCYTADLLLLRQCRDSREYMMDAFGSVLRL